MQTKTTFLPTQSNRSFVTHTHTNAHTPALWSVFESHSLLISANKFHSFVCSRAAISEREGGNGGVMCVVVVIVDILVIVLPFRSAMHTSGYTRLSFLRFSNMAPWCDHMMCTNSSQLLHVNILTAPQVFHIIFLLLMLLLLLHFLSYTHVYVQYMYTVHFILVALALYRYFGYNFILMQHSIHYYCYYRCYHYDGTFVSVPYHRLFQSMSQLKFIFFESSTWFCQIAFNKFLCSSVWFDSCKQWHERKRTHALTHTYT